MGRRTSLATLAGAKIEDVPGRGDAVLLTLPLERLYCNRFNPRRNFGTVEELREFGEKLKKSQLQPAVVVSRAAYLALWPDEAHNVGSAAYVIANGERRYRASRLVGLEIIEAVQRDDVARSKAVFLDAVQSENNDRKDLDPIERAIAIEIMVTELGGVDQVAAYYGKTKGWVSQQRKLLKLVPELQDMVSAGEMPVRVARNIAGFSPGDQAMAWQSELERRRLEKEVDAEHRVRCAATPLLPRTDITSAEAPLNTNLFTAVNQDLTRKVLCQPSVTAREVEPPHLDRILSRSGAMEDTKTHRDPRESRRPGCGGEPEDPSASVTFPYHDGGKAASLIMLRMPPQERDKVCDALLLDRQGRAPTVS
ncbi:ParB/RepB/Spo0J family partition protein [Streptomyces sp. NPDC048362]|uniref:ParB/RepB/Spo0J family partition protein n=1 Tax=Streptomyces sp. NPDC048362 TaxID=3365539 RepID=UPI0037143F6E